MLDWRSCQICYPLEIKILLLLLIKFCICIDIYKIHVVSNARYFLVNF